MSKTAIISPEASRFPPARRSGWLRCRLAPALRSTSLSSVRRRVEVDLVKYAFEISDVRGGYLRDRDFRRFAGTPLRLLVTGFVVSAASNKCRMPCSNSSTALSKAPSCPSRTIAMDMCKSNDGGRNTSTASRELLLATKRAGSNPSPYPD